MKRILIFTGVLLFAFMSLTAYGQGIRITGTVTDAADGSGIPGASIVVKGTTTGVISDIDGNYELTADPAATLVVSFVGYSTQEIPVDGRNIINVSLSAEAIGLEEVIVVAYGTTTRESFTGSASSVGNEQIERIPVSSVEQVLAGASAGVEVGTLSGQPGSFTQIRIRGAGSITASQEPLYVIDGIPVTNSSLTQNTSGSSSPLATLNPNDIESISILKDAAAASLYGSRAANGVVIITTKSGKAGETKFRFKAEFGQTDFAVPYFELATRDQTYEMKHEGYKNYAQYYLDMDEADAVVYANDEMADNFDTYDPERHDSVYDWEGGLFRKGATRNYEFSANGGTENTRFYTSFGYNTQDGYSIRNDFERISGRLNVDHEANDYISIGMNTNIALTEQNVIPDRAFYYVNPAFANQYYLNKLFPIYNEDGTYNDNIVGGAYPNLIKDLPLNLQKTDVFRSTSKAYMNINIYEGLTFRSTFGYDAIMQDEDRYWSPVSSDGETHGGYGHKRHMIFNTLTSSNILNYNNTFLDLHNIDFILGYEIESIYLESTSADGHEYPNAILRSLSVTAEPYGAANSWSENRMISYLSRLNYDYNSTYYLSASFRRDGSSRLGLNQRFANFYSISGSWRVSQMGFMEAVTDWLSDFKVRASYGTNGTLPGGWYQHMALYGYGYDYNGMPGMAIVQVYNPDLSWEKNKTINVGTDFELYNRFTFTFEYYNRTTTDLLLAVPVSRISGFATNMNNVGSMLNSGYEFSFNSTNIATTNFTWTTRLNLSHNKNEILELYQGEDIQDGSFWLREGHSYNSLYLRHWAGVDPEDGMGMWYMYDEDENPILDGDGNHETTKNRTDANPVLHDDLDPLLTGGIFNDISYRNFDLSFLFSFSYGGKFYATPIYFYHDDGMTWHSNVTKYQYENRWTEPGDDASEPRYVASNPQETNFASSRRIVSGDFLRLKSLSLGYTLPQSLTSRVGLESLRLYMTGYNLWTWSEVGYMDPEVSARREYYSELPPLKSLTFGVEVNF